MGLPCCTEPSLWSRGGRVMAGGYVTLNSVNSAMASLRLVATARTGRIRASRSFTSTLNSASVFPFRRAAYVSLFALTAGVGAVYYFDSRAAVHRYLVPPLIRHVLDPESGHKLAVAVLESGLGPRDMLTDDERLRTEVRKRRPTVFQFTPWFSALGSDIVKPYRSCSWV